MIRSESNISEYLMVDFKTYYKQYFQRDLQNFMDQIPVDGNKHYDRNGFNIQYFFLTPRYKYLDIIPPDRQGLFAVALYWTVLIDQVVYSSFRKYYLNFQAKALNLKFIGNCTAPSLKSSECGHHQHPRKILLAINDEVDKGNRNDFDREIFKSDENNKARLHIDYFQIFEQAKHVMKLEAKDFFENHIPEISWPDFWMICEKEQ